MDTISTDEKTRELDALTRLYCAFADRNEKAAGEVVKDALLALVDANRAGKRG